MCGCVVGLVRSSDLDKVERFGGMEYGYPYSMNKVDPPDAVSGDCWIG